MEEIVDSWKGKRYKKVTDQCVALLKRKKMIENLGMTIPLQRILLQAYILQNQYEKVLEWEKSGSSSTAAHSPNKREGCEDLVLYARYRSGDYAAVSKQSATADSGTNGDHISSVVLQNLQAQSNFHLNRTEEGLAVYLQLLSNDSIDDDDIESKMEVLTNALALIASSGCTPMVNLDDDENLQFWLDEAEAMLLRDDEAVDSMFADLASNLGCIRFLTDPTKGSEENWLEEAADTGEGDNEKKGTSEQTNLQWSKHFWYMDIEEVQYDVSRPTGDNANKLSVTESIAEVNRSLLDESLARLPSRPHSKWNLLQVRMYWYDRAILQLKAGKHVECQDSCQSLKKTLNAATTQGGNKKKKKNKDATEPGSNTSQSPTTLWWEARADVILAYAQQAQSKFADASARLSQCLDVLKAASPSIAVDHAVTHVLLHQFVMEQQKQQKGNKKDRERQQRELLMLLKSLPESIQSRPAAQLTMDELQDAVDNATSNNKTNSTPKIPLEQADAFFFQGQYEEAGKLYETALSNGDSSSPNIVDSQLRYVQVLAMTDRHEASQDLWLSLEQENAPANASLPDGVTLENKALPRSTTSSARSSISNNLAATGNATDEGDGDGDKPSREKLLRRRAVKREAYLKKLESEGKYNPDRPTKPDPERWIPKPERSRSSRGGNRGNRGGRNNNKGLNSAQGGGSKLDADRLDAAARRAGKAPTSNGPSSANLKVSSGGRKGGRRR